MINASSFVYELWKNDKCVGLMNVGFEIHGSHIVIPYYSMLKEPYDYTGVRDIKIPVKYIAKKINHSDTLIKTVLDVSKKSKRQINLLIARR